jgi:hypothetical protein
LAYATGRAGDECCFACEHSFTFFFLVQVMVLTMVLKALV